MWRLVFGKYRSIVAAIAMFVFLDASILLFSYYNSFKISNDTHAIQLASRQTMLTQRVFQKVYQYKNGLESGEDVESVSADISVPFNQFNEVLDAFIYGGELIGVGQGKDKLLQGSDYQDLAQKYLINVEKIWLPYKSMISPLVYADFLDEDTDINELIAKADNAISFAKTNGEELLSGVQAFAVAVENKAKAKASRLRLIQAIGITLAVINFFVILFHFIRKLTQSDSLAARAQAEKTEILDTVKDGLFLVDRDRKIGSQYSASMKTLFKRDDFAGQDYLQILKPLVDERTLESAKDYVDILFNRRVKVHLMNDLNPLKQVQINLSDKNGFSVHYFSFDFSRVNENEKTPDLLVTVTDITEKTELTRKLELSQQQAGNELDLLLSIIHINRELIDIFMRNLDINIEKINQELKYPVSQTNSYIIKINNIYRIIHALKGEASALNIKVIENKLHSMEDILNQLKDSSEEYIDGDDFLPLTIELNRIAVAKESIQKVMQRLPGLISQQGLPVGETGFKNEKQSVFVKTLEDLLTNLSKEKGMQARLDLSRLNFDLLPDENIDTLKDTFIQFIRNSVVHGLETPYERKSTGKNITGTVSISTEIENDKLLIVVKDDGRGINTQGIRNKLISSGAYSAEYVNKLKSSQLVGFLFKPGFTTLDEADTHGGRGVGLDLVKESLNALSASLSVVSRKGMYTEFKIKLPITNQYLATA